MFSWQCGLGNSTDAVLGEVKKSFLTTNPVTPVSKGPVVVSSEQQYSRVAVMRARAANDEQHTLLFLITGETVNIDEPKQSVHGHVIKMIVQWCKRSHPACSNELWRVVVVLAWLKTTYRFSLLSKSLDFSTKWFCLIRVLGSSRRFSSSPSLRRSKAWSSPPPR